MKSQGENWSVWAKPRNDNLTRVREMETTRSTMRDLRPAFLWAMARLLPAQVQESLGSRCVTTKEDFAMKSSNGFESPGKTLDSRFLKAFNANDLDAIVACYADDAVIYPPDTFMAKGKDAIRRSFQGFLSQFKISQATISDATYLDMKDRCVGWGVVEFIMTPSAGGEAMPMRGRFTSVSEKRDGRWVFTSDHASLPMAPPTP